MGLRALGCKGRVGGFITGREREGCDLSLELHATTVHVAILYGRYLGLRVIIWEPLWALGIYYILYTCTESLGVEFRFIVVCAVPAFRGEYP